MMDFVATWLIPVVTLLTAASYLRSVLRPPKKLSGVALVTALTAAVGWMVFGAVVTAFYATTVWVWYVPAGLTAVGAVVLVARWDRLVDADPATRRDWWSFLIALVPTVGILAVRLA